MSSLLQGGYAPPPNGIADMVGKPASEGPSKDPLQAVQEAINDIHELMVTVKDPQDVNNIAGCLKILAGVQQRLMASAQAAQG